MVVLKKPKTEVDEAVEISDGEMDARIRREQEEGLVALTDHRAKEVEYLRQRITYYKSQLQEAEKRLEETQDKLVRLRAWNNVKASNNSSNGKEEVLVGRKSPSPMKMINTTSQNQSLHQPQDAVRPSVDNLDLTRKPFFSQNHIQSKLPHVIPAMINFSQPNTTKKPGCTSRTSIGHGAPLASSRLTTVKSEKEEEDLIQLIGKKSSPVTICCRSGLLMFSQHKRRLRSLALCPTNDQLCVTSSGVHLLSSIDCQSEKQRRWPEDIAWHPRGNKVLSVYSADGGDSQISILDLDKGSESTCVSFLQDKPHVKSIINSIEFMPWNNQMFVTGENDHAVILWTENDEDSWKPKALHGNYHSSAVMGIAGMQHRNIVLSGGADKRIIGYDVTTETPYYRHQIDSKCMSVLPNPRDFNLIMVQTSAPERQLRLFDLRLSQMEIDVFGFKQESSESQSALINQSWSPNGLYMTSGSADPVIHIFDIRYNAHKPSQSIRAHQKRVFKAAWHYLVRPQHWIAHNRLKAVALFPFFCLFFLWEGFCLDEEELSSAGQRMFFECKSRD